MSILVVGGAGYIGSHAIWQLVDIDAQWNPKRTQVHQIIEDAWRWHQTNGYDDKEGQG